MARGTQLLQLLSMLRSELGRPDSMAVGVADLPQLRQKINGVYEQAYGDYDWPHLVTHFDKIPLAAGQRYYDLPATLDFDRIEATYIWWNQKCSPIKRGISVSDYNTFDSTNDERSSLVMKYDIRFTGTREQVEVWPTPSDDDAQEIQFVGTLKHERLVNNIDVCRLDDLYIVLTAAAATTKDKDERETFLGRAAERFATIRANARADEADIYLNLGSEEPDPYKGVTIRVS
jgi:hypothetical protein